jgi:hypothetical protein
MTFELWVLETRIAGDRNTNASPSIDVPSSLPKQQIPIAEQRVESAEEIDGRVALQRLAKITTPIGLLLSWN